jgi:hypothetical protein
MIRRYVAGALVASTLVAAWPAGAAAKGVPRSIGLCGPSACVHVSDRALRLAVARTEGRPPGPPPRLAPYLRLTTPSLFGRSGYLVPVQGLIVLGSGTYRLGPRALALARSRAAGIAPYRARIERVAVGARSAVDASRYAAILRRPAVTPPAGVWGARSLPIGLTFADPGPWAAWDSARYYPAARLIHVPDGAWVRVTPGEAAMIAAAAPARARTNRAGSSRQSPGKSAAWA